MAVEEKTGKVTERTFYTPILKVLSEKGGSGVPEVQFVSVPDIVFSYKGMRWFMSVKIGESPSLLKDAFIQYMRHKEESGIKNGMLLLLPEGIRKIPPEEDAVLKAIKTSPVTCLVDAGDVKGEYRNITFPEILKQIDIDVLALLVEGKARHFSLPLVVSLLQTQVEEVMEGFSLKEDDILEVVTDKTLLSDLGHLAEEKAAEVTTFLAAYIILSQILFLRLFAAVRPGIITGKKPVTHSVLTRAFNKILEINYRPIYEINVLDSVGEKYLQDTFDLIWGLEVEKVRYELPGRLFHALMPRRIRKMLAAFYTRPHAAEILAKLCVEESGNAVFDLACGSGTILTAAYKEGSSQEFVGRFRHRQVSHNMI